MRRSCRIRKNSASLGSESEREDDAFASDAEDSILRTTPLPNDDSRQKTTPQTRRSARKKQPDVIDITTDDEIETLREDISIPAKSNGGSEETVLEDDKMKVTPLSIRKRGRPKKKTEDCYSTEEEDNAVSSGTKGKKTTPSRSTRKSKVARPLPTLEEGRMLETTLNNTVTDTTINDGPEDESSIIATLPRRRLRSDDEDSGVEEAEIVLSSHRRKSRRSLKKAIIEKEEVENVETTAPILESETKNESIDAASENVITKSFEKAVSEAGVEKIIECDYDVGSEEKVVSETGVEKIIEVESKESEEEIQNIKEAKAVVEDAINLTSVGTGNEIIGDELKKEETKTELSKTDTADEIETKVIAESQESMVPHTSGIEDCLENDKIEAEVAAESVDPQQQPNSPDGVNCVENEKSKVKIDVEPPQLNSSDGENCVEKENINVKIATDPLKPQELQISDAEICVENKDTDVNVTVQIPKPQQQDDTNICHKPQKRKFIDSSKFKPGLTNKFVDNPSMKSFTALKNNHLFQDLMKAKRGDTNKEKSDVLSLDCVTLSDEIPTPKKKFKLSSSIQTSLKLDSYVSQKGKTSDVDNDANIAKLMSKSVLPDDLEAQECAPKLFTSKHASKLESKKQADETAGPGWYNLPRTELTDKVKHDLQLIKMRNTLDSKHHYKRGDSKKLPKYFQMGTVVEGSNEFYSARVPKKSRKNTMVDELLADAEFRRKNKEKYVDLRRKQMNGGKGHYKKQKDKGKKAWERT